jgi:hypothetical protein
LFSKCAKFVFLPVSIREEKKAEPSLSETKVALADGSSSEAISLPGIGVFLESPVSGPTPVLGKLFYPQE